LCHCHLVFNKIEGPGITVETEAAFSGDMSGAIRILRSDDLLQFAVQISKETK